MLKKSAREQVRFTLKKMGWAALQIDVVLKSVVKNKVNMLEIKLRL